MEKYAPGQFAIEITEEVLYSNRSHPQASEFTQHLLTPGLYPFVHEVTSFGPKTFSGHAVIDNKLVAHTSRGVTSDTFVPGEPNQLFMSFYTHQLEDGKKLIVNGSYFGTARKIAE